MNRPPTSLSERAVAAARGRRGVPRIRFRSGTDTVPHRAPSIEEPIADYVPLADATERELPLPPELRQGPLDERIAAYLAWVMASTAAFGAYVADPQGLPVANRNVPTEFVAISAPMGELIHSILGYVTDRPEGSTVVELEDGNLLQILWSETPMGRLALGLILPGPLVRPLIERLRTVLKALFDEKESRR